MYVSVYIYTCLYLHQRYGVHNAYVDYNAVVRCVPVSKTTSDTPEETPALGPAPVELGFGYSSNAKEGILGPQQTT